MAKKKSKIFKDALYTVELEKLKAPLFLIYTAFTHDTEIEDTFNQLEIVVNGYIHDAVRRIDKKDFPEFKISHSMEKVITITQLISACAMIFNSFDERKVKE